MVAEEEVEVVEDSTRSDRERRISWTWENTWTRKSLSSSMVAVKVWTLLSMGGNAAC